MEGDTKAREKLIEHNLRLVVFLAKKYENTGESLEDLVSIGSVGLIKGVNTYKLSKNIKLATYASRCIDNEILMFLRKNKKRRGEISFEDSLSYDSEGNELRLEDVLGTDSDIVTRGIERETERKLLYKEIDKLSEINDSINDTNSKILESMQEQIDEYRQNRDNEKTEEEIADKQRRLAYLQQDTSGANAMEILNLQKEIDEAQEDYTDTLIDQKISELQKQNDQAAEQRQRQIDILNAQLQYYQDSGQVWNDVYDLLLDPSNFLDDDKKTLAADGPLAKLLRDAADYSGMSVLGQIDWMQQLGAQVAAAFSYINANRRGQKDESITFKTADGVELTGRSDEEGNIDVNGQIYQDVHQGAKGNWTTSENYVNPEEKPTEPAQRTWTSSFPAPWDVSGTIKPGAGKNNVKGLQQALLELGFYKGKVDGAYGPLTKDAVSDFQESNGGTRTGKAGEQTKTWLKEKYLRQYKTGGLADFTGPAWLDGTKSKPEYILNADQTKAFFTLVDVLSGLGARKADSTENNRENSYDIDINVESIGSDYDVEQLANKVKSLINEDARYRNNNAINLMR